MLNARNYHSWKNDITMFLGGDNALEIVLGIEDPPNPNATAQPREYRKRRGRAATMIYSAVDRNMRAVIKSLEDRNDPAPLWEVLNENSNTSTSRSCRIETLRRFHTADMKEDTPVSVHISRLIDICQELDGSEEDISENSLVSHLLSTLPDTFTNILDILKNKPLDRQDLDTISTALIED
jgi:hypothetical protein